MLIHINQEPKIPDRVVILGAGGFVSSAAQHRLEMLNVPLLPLTQEMLDLTHENAASKLSDLLHKDDVLLFVAAKAPVKSESMLIDNLTICKTVCETLRKSPVRHVVYISSDAIYADSDKPLTESSCAQPGSLHGVMHLAREVMLANAWQGPLCLLRPTLIYGKNDPHNGYGPNRFLRQVFNDEDIILFGDGEERRDHVWIEDVAEIVSRVILYQSYGTLNIATGEVISFRQIAEKIIKLTGKSSGIKGTPRSSPMPHNGYRPFSIDATFKAFSDFRYTSFDEGIRMVFE
jgi:UDP-glucose 4-epimerase